VWLAERFLTFPRQVAPSASRINKPMKKSILFETSETARNDKSHASEDLNPQKRRCVTLKSRLNIDVKFTLEQATNSQRGGRGIALLFL